MLLIFQTPKSHLIQNSSSTPTNLTALMGAYIEWEIVNKCIHFQLVTKLCLSLSELVFNLLLHFLLKISPENTWM